MNIYIYINIYIHIYTNNIYYFFVYQYSHLKQLSFFSIFIGFSNWTYKVKLLSLLKENIFNKNSVFVC